MRNSQANRTRKTTDTHERTESIRNGRCLRQTLATAETLLCEAHSSFCHSRQFPGIRGSGLLFQLVEQPGAGEGPEALDGRLGNPQQLRGFGLVKPDEKPKLDQFGALG